MGVDYTGLDGILQSIKHVKNKKRVLTLGRQFVYVSHENFQKLFKNYGLDNVVQASNIEGYSENLFRLLGFTEVDSLDSSSYENATIIHNLNKEIKIDQTFDYIFDGGTIEHIFNQPQVLENIINLLSIDGIFCSVTTNNNFSGHGIYQFSPEFFLSCLTEEYGMKMLQLYLVEVNNDVHDSLDVNSFFNNGSVGGRNMSKFNSLREVYIVTIAQKISNDRKSLILDPPNQFSYENFDWKK